MPVDETYWPGPDEHGDPTAVLSAHKKALLAAMFGVGGAVTYWSSHGARVAWEEERRLQREEAEKRYQEDCERARIRVAEKAERKLQREQHKPGRPTHVGPRPKQHFKSGKKRF